MTEIGRKRSRKTKLVPRDCADFLDDDLVLQPPPQKKPLLEKIKKEPDFIPHASSHQFSVKVEIEDMDGSIPDEDPSDYMKYLFSLSKEAEEEPKQLDYADNSLLLEQKLVIPLPEDEKNIVDVRKVQKLLGVLHKKYPEDKEAVLYTRNQWGKVFSEKLALEVKRSPQDELIQAALERWKEWTVISRSKESPYCYKCYICNNGWWSLTEFATHITNHLQCNLQLETRHQECNIVAYGTEGLLHREIDIHGKCLKCAKTYDHHLTNKRDLDAYYYCNYCDERFHNCRALAKHEGTCARNPIRVLAISKAGKEYSFSDFSCEVCQTVFMSNPDLNEHMTICHKVRSDEPIVTKYKTCNLCEQRHFNFNFHTCLKKNANYECKHCSAKFHNKIILDHHLKMWEGVYQCRICDKFLPKSCMAGEHYALHSEHFLSVIRCLVCKKIKVFLSEDAWRNHRLKYHRRFDSRRMNCDKVIMARIMLEQCMVEPVRRTPKVQSAPRSKQDKFKLTRGETIPRKPSPSRDGRKHVRVYVPVHRNRPAAIEHPSQNTTIAHDNTVTMRTDDVPENDLIRVKQEKEDITESKELNHEKVLEKVQDKKGKSKKVFEKSQEKEKKLDDKKVLENLREVSKITELDDKKVPENSQEGENKQLDDKKVLEKLREVSENKESGNNLLENSQEVIENKQLDDKVPENFAEKVIKTEKQDDDESSISKDTTVEKETQGKKDISNIMAELNEFLDIKPDIIIKEEHMTAEETQELSSLMSSDISKVFQASSTFAEEVTDNSEHSKVFHLSKSILESGIKKEVKKEPADDDDLIILNSSDDSTKNSSGNTADILNLEPEVILKAGYRKRKIYRCNKCDYSGFHREYKEHMGNHCINKVAKKFNSTLNDTDEGSYKCTKCDISFPNLKKYALHFEKHGYRYMSCPQCKVGFDSVTKLVSHVNIHIKNQFFRIQLLNNCEDTNNCKAYQCKSCSEIQKLDRWFVHWEKHLVLAEETPKPPLENFKVGESGEHALHPNSLKEVLEVLTAQDRSADTIYTKCCIVCNRVFDRRNDTKRHLIEHLLEDAYANIVNNLMLKCQICSDLHRKVDDYKKHMRDHASLPIYKCGLCNKTFSDSSNFTKHKKIHNLKAFICDICSKKFQAKISLEKHMQMHMETDPITCDRCQKVFHDRSFYKRHVRQHHDKAVTRYRCMLCREKFTTIREKWDHMWYVHKQRKEEADCPICGISYRKFYDVKKHAYQVHGKQITLSNLWSLLSKIKVTGREVNVPGDPAVLKETVTVVRDCPETQAESSDDDCLLIEEERETLVVYD